MRWREPWAVSLRQQPRFNPLDKAARRQLLWLLVAFALVFVIGSWGKDIERHAALQIVDGSGASLRIYLPTSVSRAAIEREMVENTGKPAILIGVAG